MKRLILIAAALALTPAVGAEDVESASDAVLADTADAGIAADEESLLDLTAFGDSDALSNDELGSHSAREDLSIDQITINDQDQDGDVTDNVAMGNTNGDNLIDGDAFSNSSGFLSTVQNTGNNVLIQNSTIINVSVETQPAE